MAKKRFWLGILVMALVFGMMVVGCEEESIRSSKVEITNDTIFKIKSVIIYNQDDVIIRSVPASIEFGQKKTYDLCSSNDDRFSGYTVKITVSLDLLSDKEVSSGRQSIYGLETHKLLLSGTNAGTLELSRTDNS